jgi:hypothetical protein
MKKYLIATALSLLACATSPSNTLPDTSAPPIATTNPKPHIHLKDGGTSLPKLPSPGSFDADYPNNNPLNYRGGKVMVAPVNVYFIWYGDWSGSTTPEILEYFVSHIGGTPWFDINTSYYEILSEKTRIPVPTKIDLKHKLYVDGKVNFIQSITDNYSHGKLLHEETLTSIIRSNIDNNVLPLDANGVYFVLTSKDVDENDKYSGGTYWFCESFCGWHDSVIVNGMPLKIVFAGDIEKCPNDCSAKAAYNSHGFTKSPNNNWGADGMASVIAHELAETVVDPYPSDKNTMAWRDDWGYESSDHCAWIYGEMYISQNQSVANVKIGEKDFLIQQNFVFDNEDGHGHCGMSR